ncbi:YopX family protein [Lacticaseibacillus paracasei]|uniref:YopX family protein n=1 Tax=Lacticaseibacillus paracasei TaxID=1597 RepID=UPI0031DC407B
MKREIKFRAWDKVYECYLYDVQNAYDTLSCCVKYENGEDAGYDEECFAGFLDNDQYVVEQYTGLHDKNGRKIYEGDIVKWGDTASLFEESPVRIAVVKLDPDISFYSNVGIFDYGRFAYKKTDEYLTVIGNIFENKQLLEGKQ